MTTSVMALPDMDESRTRRKALPRVWPKPRLSGSMVTLELVSEIFSTSTRRGFNNSLNVDGMSMSCSCLFRVKFYYELFVDILKQFRTFRNCFECTFHLFGIDLNPVRQTILFGNIKCKLDTQLLPAFLPDGNCIRRLDLVGRYGHSLVIDQDRLVTDQLSCLIPGTSETHPVDHVIQ